MQHEETYLLPLVSGCTTSPPAATTRTSTTHVVASSRLEGQQPTLLLSEGKALSKSSFSSSSSASSASSSRTTASVLKKNPSALQSRLLHPPTGASTKSCGSSSPPKPEIAMIPDIATQYPQNIPFPSRGIVADLHHDAMQLGSTSTKSSVSNGTTSNNESDDNDVVMMNDQTMIKDAGLLSLESVILPALAYCEDQALIQWQKRIQRDAPHCTNVVKSLRKTMYRAMGAACTAAHDSRVNHRTVQNVTREQEWQRQRQIAQDENIRRQQLQREQRKRSAQKVLPSNQELWREIAYLQTQLVQLSQQEQDWITTRNSLSTIMSSLVPSSRGGTTETPMDAADTTNPSMDDHHHHHPHVDQVVERAQDIVLSMERVRQAMVMVRDTIVPEIEHSRKRVYQQYVSDNHQFAGYQGVQNPKGLLKALSQSSSLPDEDGDDYMNVENIDFTNYNNDNNNRMD